MQIIIIMGVSGAGKTTVGRLLSERVKLPFYDADDFHPEENKDKMKLGFPLDDDDRQPWLDMLSNKIEGWSKDSGAVLACSALKEKYRAQLSKAAGGKVTWIYLKAEMSEIKMRLSLRTQHFFNPRLLSYQFDDLEEPKYGLRIDSNQSPSFSVDEIMNYLK